ncbi:MAG: hypothetical protein ACYTFQ_00210 [Planctomycetota bacterium]|jgi:hypothetical protein
MRFLVTYGHRTDDGMNYAKPTASNSVEVDAEDFKAARLAAIDAAYEKDPLISHVTIYSVVPRPPRPA